VEDDPDCLDDHPYDCPRASYRGECWTMWESTMPACRSSCWLCVNATELRLRNVTEDEVCVRSRDPNNDTTRIDKLPTGSVFHYVV
jgi:hypothetical protein